MSDFKKVIVQPMIYSGRAGQECYSCVSFDEIDQKIDRSARTYNPRFTGRLGFNGFTIHDEMYFIKRKSGNISLSDKNSFSITVSHNYIKEWVCDKDHPNGDWVYYRDTLGLFEYLKTLFPVYQKLFNGEYEYVSAAKHTSNPLVDFRDELSAVQYQTKTPKVDLKEENHQLYSAEEHDAFIANEESKLSRKEAEQMAAEVSEEVYKMLSEYKYDPYVRVKREGEGHFAVVRQSELKPDDVLDESFGEAMIKRAGQRPNGLWKKLVNWIKG